MVEIKSRDGLRSILDLSSIISFLSKIWIDPEILDENRLLISAVFTHASVDETIHKRLYQNIPVTLLNRVNPSSILFRCQIRYE